MEDLSYSIKARRSLSFVSAASTFDQIDASGNLIQSVQHHNGVEECCSIFKEDTEFLPSVKRSELETRHDEKRRD